MMNDDAAELARLERENDALRDEVQTYRAAYEGAQLRLAPAELENIRLVEANDGLRLQIRSLETQVRATLSTIDQLQSAQANAQTAQFEAALANPRSPKFQAALEETFQKFEAMTDEQLEAVVVAHTPAPAPEPDGIQSRLQAILDAIRADVPAAPGVVLDDRQHAAIIDFRQAYDFFRKCREDDSSAETGAWADSIDWLRKASAELYDATHGIAP